MNEELKLLSISNAANVLGIGTRALRFLIAEGRIGVIHIGKREKISFKEINAFLESSSKKSVQVITEEISSRKKINTDLDTILKSIIKEKKNGLHLQA